jgi:hypothetical protein
MMEEVTTQLRDSCEGIIASAAKEAEIIASQAKEADSEATRQEQAKWEEEKKRIASTHTFDPKIKLDVGGHSFTTTLATLTRFPDTMLGAMFSDRHALVPDEGGAYFIDRDGTHFREILNFLRAPGAYTQTVIQKKGDTSELEIEADFYGLKDLMFLPPPFVPAVPVTLMTAGRRRVTVTQDDAGLWYMEGVPPLNIPRCLVKVCNACGLGHPSSLLCSIDYQCGVPRFTTGRAITDAQPKKTGTCNWNGTYCTCE